MNTSTSPAAPFRRYLCRACGWVYDEAKGDPDSGLPAGTRFEDIPDDWACPLCSVTKADFELMEPRPPAPQRPSSASHRPAASRWGGSGGKAPASVVIVGAGLIGCKLTNDLALAGHSITLIDPQPQALARWPDAGVQVQRAWQDAGVPIRFIGGVTVAQVYATDAGKGLVLSDGQQLHADHIIAATGLHTPSRLADSAGLAWNQGIAVDAHTLASSHPHIHALGDCITINGQASRYIEPIHRQAATIAAKLIARRDGAGLEACPVPYEARPPIVRIKTSSCPLTVRESLMS